MATITEKEDDDDKHDIVVDSWMQCHYKRLTITLDKMYTNDMATRVEEPPQDMLNEEIPGSPSCEEYEIGGLDIRVGLLEASQQENVSKFEGLYERVGLLEASEKENVGKFDGLDKRIGLLEASHKEILEKQDGLDKRLRLLEASTDDRRIRVVQANHQMQERSKAKRVLNELE